MLFFYVLPISFNKLSRIEEHALYVSARAIAVVKTARATSGDTV